MKKVFVLFALAALVSCNNEGGDKQDPVDSLEERKDTLMENVDSTAEAKIDSIKNRSEALKEKFDSNFNAKKDSLKEGDKK